MELSSCSKWAKLLEGRVQCQAEAVEVEWLLEREEGELVLEVAGGEIFKSEVKGMVSRDSGKVRDKKAPRTS